MIEYDFCGGIFETNCYLLQAPEGWILFDAPDGACAVARVAGRRIEAAPALTHGHFDHIPDVAKIKRRFNCPIGCHPETVPMISDPNFFRDFGFQLEIEPTQPDFLIEATPSRDFLGTELRDSRSARPLSGKSLFLLARETAHRRRCSLRRRRRALGSAGRRWRSALCRHPKNSIRSATTSPSCPATARRPRSAPSGAEIPFVR